MAATTWGGKRAGSGRKPLTDPAAKRVKVSITLDPRVYLSLREQQRDGETLGHTVERLLLRG